MKKTIISIIICVCLIAAMCTVFVACNEDNFKLNSVTYNYNGGAISQEFREAHDLQEKSIYITIINEKYYEGATNSLLKYTDLTPPSENKIFAGWYLDEDFNRPWTKINMEKYREENPDKNFHVKAKWIDAGTLDVVYYTTTTDACFKDSNWVTKTVNVSHSITEADLLAGAPTASSIQPRDGYEFAGWQYSAGEIANKLAELDAKNGQLLLSAVWNKIPDITFGFSLCYIDSNEQLFDYSYLDDCSVYFDYENHSDYQYQKIRRDLITEDSLTNAIAEYKACLALNEGYTSDNIVGWKIAVQYEDDYTRWHTVDFTLAKINELAQSQQYITDVYFTIIPIFA